MVRPSLRSCNIGWAASLGTNSSDILVPRQVARRRSEFGYHACWSLASIGIRSLDDCADLSLHLSQYVLEPFCKQASLLPNILMRFHLFHIKIENVLGEFVCFSEALIKSFGRNELVEFRHFS